jgi:Nucleotidyltransferase domain
LPAGEEAPKIAAMGTHRTLDEIKAEFRAMLPELRARYGVSYLGVFGSWTRGEQTPDSDLDLLVDFDRVPRRAGGRSTSSWSCGSALAYGSISCPVDASSLSWVLASCGTSSRFERYGRGTVISRRRR